jgi:hypothetical protein
MRVGQRYFSVRVSRLGLTVAEEAADGLQPGVRARWTRWDQGPTASPGVRIGADWINRPGDRGKECLSSGRRL